MRKYRNIWSNHVPIRLFIARMVLDGRVTRMSFLNENVQVLYGSYYVVLSVGQFQPCDKKNWHDVFDEEMVILQ